LRLVKQVITKMENYIKFVDSIKYKSKIIKKNRTKISYQEKRRRNI